MKLISTALVTTILFLGYPTSRAEFNECVFIEQVMIRLGKGMAINRQIVSAYGDTPRGEQASQDLAKQTEDYRQAKRQLKKAKCGDLWSRD